MLDYSNIGITLIVSGPSGCGKSTVLDSLREEEKRLDFSVSCTTRAPRKGEVHGCDYYFISREKFETHRENDDFIEFAEVHDNFYGTLKSEVVNRIKMNKDVILDIDVQGAMTIKKANNQNSDDVLSRSSVFVFIGPPSFKELERRLRGRGTETESIIQTRLKNARFELQNWNHYDYLLINDNVADIVKKLRTILKAERFSTKRFIPPKNMISPLSKSIFSAYNL
ncbi:MAG: guanylate kinase [Verrucomicrobiota bacterium]|nr:guanylate kinase [Verrucomicrobiota bacterium]